MKTKPLGHTWMSRQIWEESCFVFFSILVGPFDCANYAYRITVFTLFIFYIDSHSKRVCSVIQKKSEQILNFIRNQNNNKACLGNDLILSSGVRLLQKYNSSNFSEAVLSRKCPKMSPKTA